MESQVLSSLIERDIESPAPVLRPDVRFHSPAADYGGAPDVLHLLSLIALVLDDLRPGVELKAEGRLGTVIEARVGDYRLDGILYEIRDEQGRVAELTLLLRPYAGLRAAITRMGELLADSPLPSAGCQAPARPQGRDRADQD